MKILRKIKENFVNINASFLYFLFLFTPNSKAQTLDNPLEVDSIQELLLKIVEIIIEIGWYVVVIAIIYSGFLFVTAGGKEDQIKKAKIGFFWVIIGSAILLGGTVLVELIENTISGLQE